MDTPNDKMKELLYYTYRCLHFNDALIKQCDTWLSEEEGMKNMERSIREREKAKKKEKRERCKSLNRKIIKDIIRKISFFNFKISPKNK